MIVGAQIHYHSLRFVSLKTMVGILWALTQLLYEIELSSSGIAHSIYLYSPIYFSRSS